MSGPERLITLGCLTLATAMPAAAGVLDQFTPAERLGGALELVDREAPPLSPLALAEQGRQRNSGDPLVVLPLEWRRPLRQQLPPQGRLRWQRARVLRSSWPGLRASLLVPMVLHSDGSVDVFLDRPAAGTADPNPLEQAISALIERLVPPPEGALQPLLLELQPRPSASLQ